MTQLERVIGYESRRFRELGRGNRFFEYCDYARIPGAEDALDTQGISQVIQSRACAKCYGFGISDDVEQRANCNAKMGQSNF